MTTEIDVTGVAEDATRLCDLMDGVLERVASVFQSYNVNLPTRQYWTLGTPVVDCEQLVVFCTQLYLGPPGDQASRPVRCNVPRSATLSVSVSRATPTVGAGGRPPSAQKIELGSRASAIDLWVLLESVNLLDQWDDTGYGIGVIATAEADEPQGGFQTVTLQITMAVP